MNEIAKPAPRTVIPADQIQKRVREMGRQISDDYRGQSVHLLALLENGFIFMADLVRALDVPVICQFIKPKYHLREEDGTGGVLEIFFSHEPDIRGQNLLVVEGLVHSGSDNRVPDERSEGSGRGLGKAGDTARSPVGPPCPIAARLFWFSGG